MIVTNGIETYNVKGIQAEAFLNNGWKEVVAGDVATETAVVEEPKKKPARKNHGKKEVEV